MKKVKTVLDHLFSSPTYQKLHQSLCFQRLKEALPGPLRQGILFMYVKNQILFIALKHPAFKMEFDYKLPLIKNLLTTLPPLREACKEDRIDHIKTFVSRFAPPPPTQPPTEPHYKEHATPNFSIQTKNDTLKAMFEAIAQSIEKNRTP